MTQNLAKMTQDLCRICLGTTELIWIFDQRMADNMKDIISITSGVEILASDPITQQVCMQCCNITIKMFKFRTRSLKHDRELKERYALLKKNQKIIVLDDRTLLDAVPKINVKLKHSEVPKKSIKRIHPSIIKMKRDNPRIKFPPLPEDSHFQPYITLLTDEVEEWFEERNISSRELEQLKRETLQAIKTKEAKELKETSNEEIMSIRQLTAKFRTPASVRITPVANTVSVESISNSHKRIKLDTSATVDNKAPSNVCKKSTYPSVPKKSISPEASLLLLRTGRNADTPLPIASNKIVPTGGKPAGVDIGNNGFPSASHTKSQSAAFSHQPKEIDHTYVLKKKTSAPMKPSRVERSVISTKVNKNSKSAESILKRVLISPTNSEFSTNTDDETAAPNLNSSLQTLLDVSKNVDATSALVNTDTSGVEFQIVDVCSVQESSEAVDSEVLKSGSISTLQSLLSSNQKISTETIPVMEDTDSGNEAAEEGCFGYSASDASSDVPSRSSSVNGNPSDIASTSSSNSTNILNSSLLSHTKTSVSLHACKICDSVHYSLKDLKRHERRKHTKCAFCKSRFKSVFSRDYHVKFDCAMTRSAKYMKELKIVLTKVDEIDQIRKKYLSAFNCFPNDVDDVAATSPQNLQVEMDNVNDVAATSRQNLQVEMDDVQNVAATSLQNLQVEMDDVQDVAATSLQNRQIEIDVDKVIENASVEPIADTSKNDENCLDVICISDEEGDNSKSGRPHDVRPKINVVNSDILNKIDIRDSDVNILKKILKRLAPIKTATVDTNDVPGNGTIIEGPNRKSQILRNLRKHLYSYKIPIEIQYGEKLRVQYLYNPTAPVPRRQDRWDQLTAKDLYSKLPNPVQMKAPLQYGKKKVAVQVGILPGQAVTFNSTATSTKQPPDSLTKQPPDSSTKQPPDASTKQPPDSSTKQPPHSLTKQLPDSSTKQPSASSAKDSSKSSTGPISPQFKVPSPPVVITSTVGPVSTSMANPVVFAMPTTTTSTYPSILINGTQTLTSNAQNTYCTNYILVPKTLLPDIINNTQLTVSNSTNSTPVVQTVQTVSTAAASETITLNTLLTSQNSNADVVYSNAPVQEAFSIVSNNQPQLGVLGMPGIVLSNMLQGAVISQKTNSDNNDTNANIGIRVKDISELS